jgi:hypothetical protein
MEKLSINNFAGLKSVNIDVKPVTGLIGPQASGKSIIAKLLYFFREIGSRLPAAVTEGLDGAKYKIECLKKFRRYFPIENTGVSDFSITYTTKAQSISVTFSLDSVPGEGTLGIEWTDFYNSVLEKFANRKKELYGAIGDTEKEALIAASRSLRQEMDAEISSVLGKWAKFEQIFIPAGRAFFSQVRETIFTRLESGEQLDPFMAAFGTLIGQSKSLLETRGFYGPVEGQPQAEVKRYDVLHAIFKNILHANLLRIEKQDFLEFEDRRRVKLAQASSGQQEILPLLLLLARFFSLSHARGRAVYIEEPEAHLFPSTQRLVVELMARSFRAREGEMNLVITTHSPYILTSINNLLQAGQLYSTASIETAQKLGRIINKKHIFKLGEVGFYGLGDGQAAQIMDADTGLINAEVIDSVSSEIAIQFGQLLAEGHEKS